MNFQEFTSIYLFIFLFLKIVYRRTYGEPHSNPIKKFEPKSNLNLAELENELEPCDIEDDYPNFGGVSEKLRNYSHLFNNQ